jgi:thiol:disulfide interchange protein DsbD
VFKILMLYCIAGLLTPLVNAAMAGTGDIASTPHVQLSLEAEQPSTPPGEVLWLGLRFDVVPHWHLYWRNPGDSGEAPKVDWRLPAGWRAGDIRWPVPTRIPVGPLTNYGYEDSVTLLIPIYPGGAQRAGDSVRIAADVSWLVCREECIPEQASLAIDVAVANLRSAGPRPGRFETVRSQWPLPQPGEAVYRTAGESVQLRLRNTGWPTQRIGDLWFASNDWGPIAASGAQSWTSDGDDLLLNLPVGEAPLGPAAPLRGLLVMTESGEDGAITRGFEIVAPAAPTAGTDLTLLLAMGLALLGGILLNLMPCVLPVLSIKVLSLVGQDTARSARHGWVFLAGVLTTFTALASLLIGLRAAGAALGWGFQLQEPIVVIGLMYLMLALGLNLSGVYALGSRLMGMGQGMTSRPGLGGSFATGVLAVVVASPCTAPFMGTALGFAMTRPGAESLLVFAALGLGFALPVLLLSLWPRWLRWLPAPGAWMERLRNGLAFPMYGAAAWLLWVLSQQVAADTLAAALAGGLLLSFGLWWYGQPLRSQRSRRVVAATALLSSLALAAVASTQRPGGANTPVAMTWSSDRVAQLRQEGRAVLVNFTAAWCITCKVNEQVALATDSVRNALAARDIAYLKADWTRRDAAITAELQRHGRSGVPLYLLYPPGDGAPQVLPQLLTEGLVLKAVSDI